MVRTGSVAVLIMMVAVCPGVTPAADEPAGIPLVLDLESAKAIALRENPSLKAAAARVDQARTRIRQARAEFFPSVAASAGVTKTWLDENTYRDLKNQATLSPLLSRSFSTQSASPLVSGMASVETLADALSGRTLVEDDTTTYSASLAAQWRIFDGFAREFTYAASKFAAKESEAAHLETQRLLLSAVARSYFAAALAREDITIAEADGAFNRRQLKEAEARRRVGTGSLSDELNFEVRVNTAQSTLIRAQQAYSIALIGLAQLMGLPDGALPEGTELAPLEEARPEELEMPDADALLSYALAHRPDLLQRQHALTRSRSTAKAQYGAFFPSVDVSASKTAFSEEDSHLGEDDFATTLGLSISYTLFAGGRNRARVAEAKAAHAEARHDLSSAEIAALSEVREVIEELNAAREQLTLQRANAVLVQKNRDLVEKEYNAGKASLVRLNEAQKDLISAQGQLALARVGLRQAWQNLATATAEILEPYVGVE